MMQERRFPINEKVIGKKIVYTLDAVANSLLDDVPETVPQQTPVKTKVTPVKRRAIYKQAPIQDLSQKMLRMALVSNFENQIKAMEEVAIFFRGKMASDELGVILPTRDNGQILRPDKP